eukprot:COSAG03_NODE_2881_length_2382_cov_1.042050_2_plen_105_part_00
MLTSKCPLVVTRGLLCYHTHELTHRRILVVVLLPLPPPPLLPPLLPSLLPPLVVGGLATGAQTQEEPTENFVVARQQHGTFRMSWPTLFLLLLPSCLMTHSAPH